MKPTNILRLLLSLAWLCLFPALNAQTPDTSRTDYRIRINTYVFDPLQNMPVIENRLKSVGSEGDSVYRLIQFKHALLRADMDLLRKEFGLKLDQYFPNYTYLEKVSRQQLSALSRLPVFRWTGNYEPAYKISPAAGKGNFVTKERQAQRGLIINLNLHRGANAKLFGEQLRKDGIQVLRVFDQTPKQPNGRVRVRVSGTADLPKLAAYPEVKWIEEEGDITIDAADGLKPYNGGVQGIIQSNGAATPLYNNGIRGEGQVVGLIDAPLDMNHCFFTDGAVANPGPTHRKVVGFRQVTASPFAAAANCNSGHGTHTAGTVAGNSAGNANNGIAFNAKLTYGDLNDVAFSNGGGTRTFAQYLDEARSDGAFVHSNSWSDKNSAVQNAYTALSQDLDDFTWNDEDQLVVVSSGNNIDTNNDGNSDSPSPIRPPFSSKNGLCVAASSEANTNNIATGGVGPTFDNRRKPEIYAPGSNTTSSQAGTNCTTFACFGSSMATPAVAASGALVRQYFTEGWYPSGTKRPDHAFTPSGALLKATLLNATRNMTGTDAFGVAANVNGYPTNLEGWGELVLDDALYFAGDARNTWVWDVRHDGGLNTGETNIYFLPVATNTQPLKVTLTWMEPPAANANFGAPVVNDVNLRVTAPDGTTVFLGNNFNAGQSATGGAFDGVNNVEMVLVNTPQTGTWRIEVIGTAINQGNPSQGYALVATADTQEPPSPTGVQNTLVLRAAMPGTTPAGAPGLANCQNLMTNINTYISEVSYGQTTIVPVFRQVTLTTPLGTYLSNDHNPLIEMAEDAIDNIVAAEPGIFDQGPGTADDISRIVILLNDQGFTGDWATTGPWPYSLPAGLTRPLSVSVTSANTNINPQFRLEHAVCHQLGLMDLYPHPGVAFAQPHVDNWDIMANQNEVQPLGWSKEKALWMSTHNASSIRWIPRPAAGIAFDQEIPLNILSSTNTASPRVIAIGQTPGVTSMANENVFFFVEARSNAAGSVDSRLPESGVLLYTVNENIRQGEGPVQIIDQVVSTDLDDAALEANGQAHNLSGSYGLTVTRRAPTGGENVRVRIQYDPPETDNDVNIVVGDPFWISPDIWIDSQEDGFDTDNGNTPADRGNSPVAGETNRIYFTVHNPGPGTAFDVTVAVRISEPYHTIGGDADFNRFVAQKFYASIAPGANVTDFVDWTPAGGDNPHACIQVEILDVFNDVNDFNNKAQQNVDVVESRTASPYETVTYHFSVTNPYDYHQLFYFRAEQVPPGWTAAFAEPKKMLAAHERYEGSFTVHPPDNAPVCTDHQIYITSWMPKGNTIIPYGGGTLQVNLRSLTTLTANTTATPCRQAGTTATSYKAGTKYPSCYTLTTTGCTNPAKPNAEIIVRYEAPDGTPVYHVVLTDAMGCYSDTYVVAEGGEWKASAKYKGTKCDSGSSTGEESVPVSLPTGDPQTPGEGGGTFGDNLRKAWISAHVGSTHPLGALDRSADANIYAMADLTFPVRENLNLQLLLGLCQLTAESSVGIQHPRWLHASANVMFVLPRPFDMKPYVRAGVGVYRDKNNNNTAGINVGIGGLTRVTRQLIIMPGLDVHFTSFKKDGNERLLTAHLGIIFR